jgi:excisionase family DNA binding protein
MPDVLTVDELAERLRIGRRAAYEAVRRGEIPGVVRVGRSIRISTHAVDEWLSGPINGTERVAPGGAIATDQNHYEPKAEQWTRPSEEDAEGNSNASSPPDLTR